MPELVVRDASGRVETVAYQELPAMLLNELQRQHATIQAQRAEIEALKAKLADGDALRAEVAALAGRVERLLAAGRTSPTAAAGD